MNNKALALKPRLSEKSYALSEERNTYAFDVPPGFNRLTLARAVADQYDVKVESVRIAKLPGKSRRTYRRGGRVVLRGKSSAIRKAYVRLAEGQTLPIFAATDEKKPKASSSARAKGDKK